MVNISKVIQGGLVFFFGILITLTTYYWIPELISVIDSTGTLSSTVIGLIWLGLFITWTMLLIVLPGMLIVSGIQEN